MTDTVPVVIPARGGSKGIPRKNLRRLGEKPLVAHQIASALEAESVGTPVVSTDDEEIAAAAEEYGAEVPFTRPDALATDDVPVIAVVEHFLEHCLDTGVDPAYVLCLQPTSPFTTAAQIDAAVEKARSTRCDSVVSVTKVTDTHPYRAYRMADDRVEPLPFTEEVPDQRQDRPDVYGFTGAIYLRQPNLLLDWDHDDFALGTDVRGIVQEGKSAVEIDTEFQLTLARALLAYQD
ncbi:acylneuraminate cytidylyltransferase family protein [Haloarcula sp. JP-L23]|uniref:acylneuraminate cytidylyltransferase family protein n=1 Tax=Haloarcula sp. JP-L23 TaxID=2716717 RepID=UPI00140F2791|nr:acylneuraminate cytidylyltransferase family protein [Haloarcula sp. JP-L23]